MPKRDADVGANAPRRGEPGPRKKAGKKKRRAMEPAPAWRLPVLAIAWAGGAALLAVVVVVGILWAVRRGRARIGAIPAPIVRGNAQEQVAEKPFPPVPWKVPSGAPPAEPVAFKGIDLPWATGVSFLPGHPAGLLAVKAEPVSPETKSFKLKNTLVFALLDPRTGQPDGAWRPLGPGETVIKPSAVLMPSPGSGPLIVPRAAVGPKGTLALVTGQSLGFTVWEPSAAAGRRVQGLTLPDLPTWFDWSADGKLLVITKGELTAWDVTAGKPLYSVGERLTGAVALSPARNWLAVVAEGRPVEVLDAATGECLGRLGDLTGWRSVAVSPDATRVAGLRRDSRDINPPICEIHEWDLKTGEPQGKPVRFRREGAGGLTWVGPRQIVAMAEGSEYVVDLDARIEVAALAMPMPESEKGSRLPPVASLTGRTIGGKLLAVRFTGPRDTFLPGRRLAPIGLPADLPGGDGIAFRPSSAVQVEADCGDPARSERAAAALTAVLKDEGYAIGPGDWTLRAKGESYDTGERLEASASTASVSVPGVRGAVQLVSPEGTALDPVAYGARFARTGSRYYTATKVEGFDARRGGMKTTASYNFGGRDPSEAMAAETWDRFVEGLSDIDWPRGMARTPGGYARLTLVRQLQPP